MLPCILALVQTYVEIIVAVEGKGFFIWRILNCEGGDVEAIASKAEQAQLTHVLIKIADTRYPFGFDRNNNDLLPPITNALKERGICGGGICGGGICLGGAHRVPFCAHQGQK